MNRIEDYWTLVTVRMPVSGDNVITTYRLKNGVLRTGHGKYSDEFGFSPQAGGDSVVAWMREPESYGDAK